MAGSSKDLGGNREAIPDDGVDAIMFSPNKAFFYRPVVALTSEVIDSILSNNPLPVVACEP
jgi:hypothetical protein